MNSLSRIVFLDRGTLPAAIRTPALPLQWQEHESTASEQVVERLESAEVAVTNKVALMGASLAQLPQLKLIAVAATGTNNVDLDYCECGQLFQWPDTYVRSWLLWQIIPSKTASVFY
jgi:glycerate dehydrogenase